MRSTFIIAGLLAGGGIAALIAGHPAQAQASVGKRSYDIPSQRLDLALNSLAEQSRVQIMFDPAVVRQHRSMPLKGSFAPGEGIRKMLAGSNLAVTAGAGGVYVVKAARLGERSADPSDAPPNGAAQNAASADTEELAAEEREIVVTGSRIERAGFDQPTPTTVIGAVELRQGQRPNLQQVLNDQPAFRPSFTPQSSAGSGNAGVASVDLRGLGPNRTLTLLNGRRFIGQNNLTYVPMSLVNRVEVVTGGASAAYGSDAVAGVVNIVLADRIEGISVRGITGISSRGDGARYGGELSMGTSFDDGRGQLMFGAEYVKDESIRDRNSRRNLGSVGIVRVNPTDPADFRQRLVRDVNSGNVASQGLITSGILAGQLFEDDGSLRPYRAGVSLAPNPATRFPAQVLGGADAVATFDSLPVTGGLDRISTFARASYDLGGVKIWGEFSYGRSRAADPGLADIGAPPSITVQASNPFLSPAVRAALAAAGETSFTLGRFFDGPFMIDWDFTREQKEGAIGLDADLGGSWKAKAHFSHGEVDIASRIGSRNVARFNNAINAVSSGGQIVCAINADANPANDDPACRPLNLFGRNTASAEALAYIRGVQSNDTTNKMDAAAIEVQGDLFSLWSGPITVALGAEARWEEQTSRSDALTIAGAYGPLTLYGSPVNGGFNVKEGFGEIALPLLDVEGSVKIDLNGAARYSDYSRSGGIWSWKAGGTAELFDTLMLRATRSRDIRAPTITELFSVRSVAIAPLVDQDSAGRAAANPAYNPTPAQVTTFSGGNVDLLPEISYTTTFGATFSPRFLRGFNMSIDYYDIKIDGAITTLSATALTLACRNGNALACDRITRDSTGTVTEVRSNAQNVARFETSGFDIEASYVTRMPGLTSSAPGTLRIRALANHVRKFVLDTGVSRIDSAGDMGTIGAVANAIPSWRGVLGLTYQDANLGLDARVRYIGSGKFNHLLDGILVNNRIPAFVYLDVGAEFKVTDAFSFSLGANNVFDKAPPLSPTQPIFHDAIGRYFTFGARAKF